MCGWPASINYRVWQIPSLRRAPLGTFGALRGGEMPRMLLCLLQCPTAVQCIVLDWTANDHYVSTSITTVQ
jgi:hypothetical protein